jgi:hypothetical protein
VTIIWASQAKIAARDNNLVLREITMELSEKISFTTAVFTRLASEKMDRLNRGLVLRQAMHDAIKRGEKPTGYRPQWVQDQALELVKTCGLMAQKFDEAHPDDKASVSDLLDILATAMGLFKKHVRD